MTESTLTRTRLAVTLGDPRGIGPEIVAAALADARVRARAELVIVGPSGTVVPVNEDVGEWHAGRQRRAAGRLAGLAIERATALALAGDVQGIVTAPIDKHALLAGGYDFPGHTEMLARSRACARRHDARVRPPARRARDHAHRAARCASTRSRASVIVECARDHAARTASELYGIAEPRIALCALNPHAGDGGRFGDEDDTLLAPAARDASHRRTVSRRTPCSCARCAASSTPCSRRITMSA